MYTLVWVLFVAFMNVLVHFQTYFLEKFIGFVFLFFGNFAQTSVEVTVTTPRLMILLEKGPRMRPMLRPASTQHNGSHGH